MKRTARRQFLKQSSLATMIAASRLTTEAFSQNQTAASPSQYRGPLADFDLNDREFDSLQFCLSSYEQVKPSMSFSADNEASARAWQKQVRSKLVELLGGFPSHRVALRARVLEKKDMGGYTREKIIFQSRDNLSVFGYLLLPKNRSRALPAVVCLPGHGRGVDDVVGIAEKGEQREGKSSYEKDFAIQVVENGYAAFAIEQLAFGCRRDEAARKKGASTSSCQPAAGAALLFGQTMIAWRVWDVFSGLATPKFVTRETAVLLILAASLLVFRTLRERCLMVWIVGWLAYNVSPGARVLLYVNVRNQDRRQGIGKAMLDHAGLRANDSPVMYLFDGPSASWGRDRHRSTRTSQPTWKKSSRTANRGIRQRGSDPRLQRNYRCRTQGTHSSANPRTGACQPR